MSEPISSPVLTAPARRFKIIQFAWIGLAGFSVLLALILVAPHFVDLGLFKRTYLPLLEDALNRRIDVGEVHLSLIPTPSIRMSKLEVSDSAAFAENTFFTAGQIQLKLRFWPLLRGRFEVTELVLEKPVFNLLKQPDGSFNYADLGGKKTPANSQREMKRKSDGAKLLDAPPPLALPNRVRINDGQLNLITKGLTPVNIKGIDLTLQEFSETAPFPFRVAFNYPGLKTVTLEGELNYQEEKALLELKNNRLKIQDLTFPVQGSVSNLSTTPRVNLNLAADKVDAGAIFQILSVFGLAPRDTEMSGPMGLIMTVTGPANALVTQVRGFFRDVKVHGKRALKGTLNGEVNISLALGGGALARRLQGNGKLAARDGELINVDLINKIQRVTGMIGLSKDERREATTFKTMEAEFIVGGGYADFSRLYLINPQMEVTGKGTMTIDQPTLNVTLETVLSAQASARAGRGRRTAFFKDSQGRVVVPLRVTGPVENPAVNLNSEKLAEATVPKALEKNYSSFFKGLFRDR